MAVVAAVATGPRRQQLSQIHQRTKNAGRCTIQHMYLMVYSVEVLTPTSCMLVSKYQYTAVVL